MKDDNMKMDKWVWMKMNEKWKRMRRMNEGEDKMGQDKWGIKKIWFNTENKQTTLKTMTKFFKN